MSWFRSSKMRTDRYFMRMALRLAQKGLGKTSPNPMVGAVVVKAGKVVGRGYHKEAGLKHAEIVALDTAGDHAKGATVYVTLEPCTHFGKTPPCVNALIERGVKRVVSAMKDPNPVNNGKAFRVLKARGIKVSCGLLEKEAKKLNEVFIKYITSKRPFITCKLAQTLDGKIATKTGDSKWITGKESRRFAHELRSQADAVMVGVGTIIKDDPLLTSRKHVEGLRFKVQSLKQPIKIIVDSTLRAPSNARIFGKDSPAKVILATTKKAPKARVKLFKKLDCEVLMLNQKNGTVSLRHLMKELGKRQITSVLVEGGGELVGGLVDEKLVDKFLIFVTPKIIGGKNAITSVEGKGVDKISKAIKLKGIKYRRFKEDLLIEGYCVSRHCEERTKCPPQKSADPPMLAFLCSLGGSDEAISVMAD